MKPAIILAVITTALIPARGDRVVGVTGLWHDAFGKPWTVRKTVRQGQVRFQLLRGDARQKPAASTRPVPFPFGWQPRGGSGMTGGIFTTRYVSTIIKNCPDPDIVYVVDTRRKDVLIVTVSSGWSRRKLPQSELPAGGRFELLRDKDMLSRAVSQPRRGRAELDRALASGDWTVRREALRELARYHPAGAAGRLVRGLGDEYVLNRLIALDGLRGFRDPAHLPAILTFLQSGYSHIDESGLRLYTDSLLARGIGGLEKLMALMDAEAIPLLLRAWRMTTNSSVVHGKRKLSFRNAADMMVRSLKAEALPVLWSAVRDGKRPRARGFASRMLRSIRSEAFMQSILKHILDDAPRVRLAAIDAIDDGYHDVPEAAAGPLAAALKTKDPAIQRAALKVLERMGARARSAGPALVELAAHAKLHGYVEHVLRRTGSQPQGLQEAFDKLLKHPKAETRCRAIRAVARALRPAAAPLAVAALSDPHAEVRWVAAWEIGSLIGPAAVQAVPRLIQGLADKRYRPVAAYALGGIGPGAAAAVPALISALEEDLRAYRVINALGSIGPAAKDAVVVLAKALRPGKRSRRACAAKALAKIGPTRHDISSQLLAVLSDEYPTTRSAAVVALGKRGVKTVEVLRALKSTMDTDKFSFVRILAAEAYWRLTGDADAVLPELIRQVDDDETNDRRGAARVLAEMLPTVEKVRPVLERLRRNRDFVVRKHATEALKKAGGDS